MKLFAILTSVTLTAVTSGAIACANMSGVYEIEASKGCFRYDDTYVMEPFCDQQMVEEGTSANHGHFVPGGEVVIEQKGCDEINFTYDSKYEYVNPKPPGKASCRYNLKANSGSGQFGSSTVKVKMKGQNITRKFVFNRVASGYIPGYKVKHTLSLTKNADQSVSLSSRNTEVQFIPLREKADCRLKWIAPVP